VDDTMQDWLEVLPAVAGLHISVLIREGRSVSDVRVAERAQASGLVLLPISLMYLGPAIRQGFVLGYGGLSISSIAESMRRLRVCLEAEAGSRRNRH
jgi:GntR family transcriptional regulator/MocR family aminotransferase